MSDKGVCKTALATSSLLIIRVTNDEENDNKRTNAQSTMATDTVYWQRSTVFGLIGFTTLILSFSFRPQQKCVFLSVNLKRVPPP